MPIALRTISGCLLILGLAYVPWHAGGTAPVAGGVLLRIVMISGVFWLLSQSAARKPPAIPRACLVGVVVLLIQGWWMVINAHHRYDPMVGDVLPIRPPVGWLPGSVDASASRAAVINATSMLAIICIACDLGRDPRWRRRLWLAPFLIGASIALYGILDRLWAGRLELFDRPAREGSPFSTFNYHGIAGAFLNLCLPGAVGLMMLTLRRGVSPLRRVVAGAILLSILCGVVLNVSRAAHAIAVLIFAAMLGWSLLRRSARGEESLWSRELRARVALVVLACAAIGATAAAANWNRWALLPSQTTPKNPRLLMWRLCWQMLPQAGPVGCGPGTYKLMYPHGPGELLRELYPRWIVQAHVPGRPVSIWGHVHNDYLQIAFEWGWLGAGVWVFLLFGGVVAIARRRPASSPVFYENVMAASVVLAVAGVLIHALIDFPIQIPSVQAHLAVYVGLTWRIGRRDAHLEPHAPGE
jgi:O-antigen ligase